MQDFSLQIDLNKQSLPNPDVDCFDETPELGERNKFEALTVTNLKAQADDFVGQRSGEEGPKENSSTEDTILKSQLHEMSPFSREFYPLRPRLLRLSSYVKQLSSAQHKSAPAFPASL